MFTALCVSMKLRYETNSLILCSRFWAGTSYIENEISDVMKGFLKQTFACFSVVVSLCMMSACGGRSEAPKSVLLLPSDTVVRVAVPDTPMEASLREMGLVDVQDLDSTIRVHLVYATARNFTGQVLYADLHKAFLLPEMAEKVVAAQKSLHLSHPDWNLLVLDAARPLSVQRKMFKVVARTPNSIYVSNPQHGPGLHNYGAAVDVTLVDSLGEMLPMGTGFDHFGPEAHIDKEQSLLAQGKITRQELNNRQLLRGLMKEQGLLPLYSEWWHFNLMSRSEARHKLKVIE